MAWPLKKRGRNTVEYENPDNPLEKRLVVYMGPRHVLHRETKEYVELNWEANSPYASGQDCRFFAQNAHVSIEVYDYYVKLYDPDYESVSVYDERFTPQIYHEPSKKWRDIGVSSPSFEVFEEPDGGVTIKRVMDTNPAGQLEVSYVLKVGGFLKHQITFTNLGAPGKFRVIQNLAGITASKIKYGSGEEEITGERHLVIPYFFIESPSKTVLTEYLWTLGSETDGEWINDKIRDIIFDTHPNGIKTDIIIGDYDLNTNESLEIDPTTTTFYEGGGYDDAHESGGGNFYNDLTYLIVKSHTNHSLINCSGLRFVNVTIPQGSNVIAASFSIYAYLSSYDDANMDIYGNDIDDAEDFNDNQHVISETYRPRTSASISWVQDDLGTGWKTKTGLENIVKEIVDRENWSSGNDLALLLIAKEDVNNKYLYFYSYDYNSSKAAKIEVTYEEGGPILKEVTDSIGLSDAPYAHKTFTVSDESGIGLSDAPYTDKTFAVTDSIGLSDAPQLDKPVAVTDSIDSSDAPKVVTKDPTTATDSVGLSDALFIDKTLTVMDSIGVSDTPQLDKPVAVSDALSLSDQVFRDKVFEVLDAIGLSDSITTSKLFEVLDSIGLTDSILTQKELIQLTDAIGLTDTPLTPNKTMIVADAVSLSDTPFVDKILEITDTLGLSDTPLINKVLSIADSISLIDQVLTDKTLSIFDSVSLTDLVEVISGWTGILVTLLTLLARQLTIQVTERDLESEVEERDLTLEVSEG